MNTSFNCEQLKLHLEQTLTAYSVKDIADIVSDYMSIVCNMKSNVVIKVINKSNNELPSYLTEGSVGMDIRAYIPNDLKQVVIEPGSRVLIHTGLYMEIPIGYEVQIRARSSMTIKQGIGLLNGIGTIDSDYRNEIGIILYNSSNDTVAINHGDRVAQMIVAKVEKATFRKVDALQTSTRNGSFDSIGK